MTNALIEVHESPEELATIVAGELLNRLADLQAAGLVPHVCLTGGTIADAVHREVARLADGSGVDWGAVDFWFGDERFVAPDSPDRNAAQAQVAFLDALGVPAHRVHTMPSTEDAPDVAAGAASYSDEVRRHGPGHFDVLMLGVGPDGHIASLFPAHPQLDMVAEPAVGVTDSPKPPPERITLTFETLRRSRTVFFLVSGEAKAGAVASAMDGDDLHTTPAAGVTGTEETVWFLDRGAASRL